MSGAANASVELNAHRHTLKLMIASALWRRKGINKWLTNPFACPEPQTTGHASTAFNVKEGDTLLAINGIELKAPQTPYELMLGISDNEMVTLTLADNPSGERRNVVVKPVKDELRLREKAFIDNNRQTVDRLSGGRIACSEVAISAPICKAIGKALRFHISAISPSYLWTRRATRTDRRFRPKSCLLPPSTIRPIQ